MAILYFILSLYLLIGFVYAVIITWMGVSEKSAFLINMLGGPVVLVYNYIMAKRGKLGPLD